MHRVARRMLMTRRGGYELKRSPTSRNVEDRTNEPPPQIDAMLAAGLVLGSPAAQQTAATDPRFTLPGSFGLTIGGKLPAQAGINDIPGLNPTYYGQLPPGQLPTYRYPGGYHQGAPQDMMNSTQPMGGYDGGSASDPFSSYAARVRQIESGGDRNAVTGHNYGLFQFGPEEMRKYGISDWRSEGQQYSGLQQEYAEHSRLLRESGLPITPENLYLTHQQGVGGGPALLSANPNTPAWQVLRRFYPSDAVAQKAITGNIPTGSPLHGVDPDNITVGQFVNLWQGKYSGQPVSGTQVATPTANPEIDPATLQKLANMQQGNSLEGMAQGLLKPQQQVPQQSGFAPPGGPLRLNPPQPLVQSGLLQKLFQPQFGGQA